MYMTKFYSGCMDPEVWKAKIETEVINLLNKDNLTPVERLRAYCYSKDGDDEDNLLFIKAIEQIIKEIRFRDDEIHIMVHRSFMSAPNPSFERLFTKSFRDLYPGDKKITFHAAKSIN